MALVLLSIVSGGGRAEAAGRSVPVSVPYEFIDNRIVIDCFVNGKGPFAFLVDTGSPIDAITPEVSRRAHISGRHMQRLSGAGSKSAAVSLATIHRLSVGSLASIDVDAYVIDLSAVRAAIGFPHLDGILGYETAFLHRRTFVDADRRMITFDAGRVAYGADAVRAPFTYVDGLMRLAGELDGVPGSLVVDTGDRSSITLFKRFATAHHFYARSRSVRNVLTGYGIGGPIYSDVFRLSNVKIFGRHVRGALARASRDVAGVFATSPDAGSFGGGILSRFNVVYDDRRRLIIAWPSLAFRRDDAYDPLGIWIAQTRKGPAIVALTQNGAAARAGVKTGDIVLSIAGRSSNSLTIPQLRALVLTSPDGSTVTIAVSRTSGSVATYRVPIRTAI